MKNTIASLASASVVVALGLSLVAPVSAQTTGTTYGDTTGTNNSTVTTASSTTNGTTGTTDTSGSMTTDTTNPGLPNTGAGGDAAMNFAILLGTGLLAVGGTVLAARKLAL